MICPRCLEVLKKEGKKAYQENEFCYLCNGKKKVSNSKFRGFHRAKKIENYSLGMKVTVKQLAKGLGIEEIEVLTVFSGSCSDTVYYEMKKAISYLAEQKKVVTERKKLLAQRRREEADER